MAGRLGDAGLGDDGVNEVLDLCLECRACKAECPVGVDVARFKSEFLADYWKRHGTPLRVKAIGNISTLLAIGSHLPGVTNAIASSTPGRWLAEMFLGIDRRRSLPTLASETFVSLFSRTRDLAPGTRNLAAGTRHQQPAPSTQHPAPVLFADTFTNYCRPDIGIAAVDVLQKCGLAPKLVPHVCCGRPLISKGLLDDARTMATQNTEALYDAASSGHPLVFLEPSCLSAVREDAPDLLRGDAQRKARVVASACTLFEDFLEERLRSGTIAIDVAKGPRSIVLHGHCHQKAMGLLPSARALLSRIPGSAVVDLDAGCCGMAGSFGYTRDHYDVSQAIGERRLLPAARAMTADAVLVASGTSCREQVAHFSGVNAKHPAELLCSLLSGDSR